MAYSDISTLKSEVPKRSRIVSEQEQAKTDNRRAVRFDKNLRRKVTTKNFANEVRFYYR